MAIRLLDDRVVSQIAAGEVVERPASVVKELVENALDAGASFVQIEIADSGRRRIQVNDDGSGIPVEEVPLAVMRHATSKLVTADDLSHIETLGFRGEALASVAAVSRLTVTSRYRDADVGVRLRIEGGELIEQATIGAPVGTIIAVENLFFNTPARKKFLKSDMTEKRVINQIVMNYAMAYPHVRFVLIHDDREVFRSPGTGNFADVVVKVVGLSQFRQMVEVSGQDVVRGHGGTIRVRGFVSEPNLNRKDRTRITLFVNGRAVQDNSLSYAVSQAYHTLLPKGRYPYGILLIQVPPEIVDVNVHPTKAEVRFEDASAVFAAVQRAVRDVILGYSQPSLANRHQTRPIDRDWDDDKPTRMGQMDFGFDLPDRADDEFSFGDNQKPAYTDEGEQPQRVRTLPVLRVLGQIGAAYIVTEGPAGMYLIDQHGAHQRILYESFRRVLEESDALESQPIETQTIDVSVAENRAIQANMDMLERLGFVLESFGINTYALRAVPVELTQTDIISGLAHLIERLQERIDPETLLMHLADVIAVKRGVIMPQEDMQALIRELEYTPSPKQDTFGETIILHFSAEQIARQFRN
ncbi:MAG: DNA mismatch repair endonuclease MutL [Anaerolineae bacterium]|nr:DNA mismatch repair endonuclease MutL [Anaerolineae bacterium]MCA9892749.1 DNA mismatch repair endonuclease MutL [Anaerolineae bacterium]